VNLLVSLHVIAAVFLLGPLVFATSATPRAIRTGGADTLRFLAKTSRIYAYASILVFLLGAADVQSKYGFGWSQTWVWLSTALFVVAFGLITALVLPSQRKALAALEAGGDGRAQVTVIAAAGGTAALLIVVIPFLMIYQPGLG
jgi:uncharacterized membrane protein